MIYIVSMKIDHKNFKYSHVFYPIISKHITRISLTPNALQGEYAFGVKAFEEIEFDLMVFILTEFGIM